MAAITIDGERYEVEEGQSLLQALDGLGVLMNGVDVPHYCWHPKLSVDGSCRLCQVEVDGAPKLQIACDTPVRDGMVVHTDSERVRQAREGVMELLLVNHPLDCPICDQAGECKLQDYAFEYGVTHARTREPRRALAKNVDLGPEIVLDQERCILCRRCVRFCREVPETGELAVGNRGDRSTIEAFPGMPLDNAYSMNVADICPVGALTTKDFRFKIRVWFLDERPGVCTGCANGCNLHVGVASNRVYRYVPRRNDAVNDTWICDAGRKSHVEIGAPDRLRETQLRRARESSAPGPIAKAGPLETCTPGEAVETVAARIRAVRDGRGGAAIGALASAHATNEDLFVLRALLAALGAPQAGLPIATGASDALLVKSEKAANGAGARALGFGAPEPVLERAASGETELLFVLGHDLAELGVDLAPLAGLRSVVLLDTHHSPLERVADVVFPARHALEKYGTLTNYAGRVQRVEPVVEPTFEAWDEGEVLTRIAVRLALPGFALPYSARDVSRALAAESPFEGCSWDGVGAGGATLGSAAPGAPEDVDAA